MTTVRVRFHPSYPNVPLQMGVYGGGVELTCDVSKLPIVEKDTYWSNRDNNVDILDICMPPGDIRFHDKYPKVPLLHYIVQVPGTTCNVTGKQVSVGDAMWGNRTHNIDVSEGAMPSVVSGSGYGVQNLPAPPYTYNPSHASEVEHPSRRTLPDGTIITPLGTVIGGGSGKVDIGTFGLHQEKPGISFLTSAEVPDRKTVLQLIEEIGGSPEATFDSYPEVCVLGQKERTMLIDKLDQQCGNEKDYKWSVTPSHLKELIGKEQFQKIADRFPSNDYNEIKLRRCCAEGQCINFHTDFSECTMQIPLNSDTEYVGGQLVFATSEGLQYPSRPAGGITIHRNDIVHGVTRMEQGVRYGLFFLKNEEKK